ncbi:MAG: helix-turn-helix domain-containing protein [Muribaculaceae bacterium]|nr:helix-turn-helix domain-containing protein [Muribaculaceae bacterium]
MSTLKSLRLDKGLTQKQASEIIGVSLRTYKSYENDPSKSDTTKYKYMLELIGKYVVLDEEHGLLSLEEIKNSCNCVFKDYPVKYCILFGTYSKGCANEKSNVNLLISTEATGLRFYEIVEQLRSTLHKNVDLLDVRQLINNHQLLDDILSDGIKVYENYARE